MSITLDQLAEEARAGNRDSLEALVRGLQDPMYRLALRILGHPEQARDATQEILILVITQLSSFRGESSIKTWAYRVATRHVLRMRSRARRWTFESLADDDLGQPPNAIEPETLAHADARLLEEETFLGCTQAMLQALDADKRIAFVLGAICELDSHEAADILEISEAAFRKRLSRARAELDAFVGKHCGVADPANRCRCAHQVNLNVARGCVDPARLTYALSSRKTTVEALRALGEIREVRRSLELYRAQPAFEAPADYASAIRSMIDRATSLSVS
ncbi:MAG: RNA polymerase sigma factor [Polyangiaceae bacterium]|nr:RNA polymerase sigma factor [Polyangiaceae bacterium]